MTERALLYELSFEQMQMWLADLDQPPYRAAQVFEWAYRRDARSFDEMTNLPADLRAALAEHLTIGPVEPLDIVSGERAVVDADVVEDSFEVLGRCPSSKHKGAPLHAGK